jgi:hypothetical protein
MPRTDFSRALWEFEGNARDRDTPPGVGQELESFCGGRCWYAYIQMQQHMRGLADPGAAGSKILPIQPQDRPGRVVLIVTLYEAKDLSASEQYKQVSEAMDLGHGDMVRLLLDSGANTGLAQPAWRHHECVMAPRQIYFKVLAGLRANVEETQ